MDGPIPRRSYMLPLCRSQVSYHIFLYYFITRIESKGNKAGKTVQRKLPSRFRQVLSTVSCRTRHPISMTLVPTQIKPGSVTADRSSFASSAERVYYC